MRRTILVFAILGGVAAAFTGVGLGGVLLLSSLMMGGAAGAALIIGTIALGATVVVGGLGLLLAWSAWQGLSGAADSPFRLPGWGWWLLTFALAVAAGYVAFEAGFEALVAVLHVAASALAAFWALALATDGAQRSYSVTVRQATTKTVQAGVEVSADFSGQRNQPAKASSPETDSSVIAARPALGSLAWGGLGGTGLAFFVEALVLLAVFLLFSFWLTVARPDLLVQLQEWAERLQHTRPDRVLESLPALRSPWLAFGVLALASVLVPVVEESAKALAVPLVALTGRRVRWADGFLLGAAAGAGFALLEGTLNGALGLTSPVSWAGAMLSRGAATTMHCAASGLAGLGWALMLERRWLAGLGAGLTAVTLHGAWNAAAIGLAAQTLVGGGNALAALFVGYLGVLWLCAALLLALLPRWLAGHDESLW